VQGRVNDLALSFRQSTVRRSQPRCLGHAAVVQGLGWKIRRQCRQIDGLRRRQENHDLHDVAQLAQIAGPGVPRQRHQDLWLEILGRPALSSRHLAGKVRHQLRQVLLALAQRRYLQRCRRDSIVEIFAKSPGRHLGP